MTYGVVQRPAEFVAITDRFKALDPTYVRSFFAGLSSALKNGAKFDWRPVLELATWVSTQPRRIGGRKGGGLMVADPDWGWTRDSIIDLLKAGFEGGGERLPYEHRELVWSALVPLTDDPFPSPEDERGEKFDPSFLSINCTRGRALHASLDYARWVRDCANARKRPEHPPATLNVMPEMRELLERHLDIGQEPTLTIRSVYGQELSTLANLDLEWFRAKVKRIFPLGSDESAYFNAAWESFVVFNQPHAALLREMIPAYRKAIVDLGAPRMMHSTGSPDDSLADHLMAYYSWGELKFDGEHRLLEDFYGRASDRLRAHVMWFIGRSAAGWNDAPAEAFERLRQLMDRRLQAAEEAASPADFMKELAGFGWLFTSEKFDEAWSIRTLLKVLELTKKIDDGMDVIKRLADLSPKYPEECMACLALMVEGDREGWVIVGVEAETRRSIKGALDSEKPEAVMAGKRLAELLIGRGNYGFRELLG